MITFLKSVALHLNIVRIPDGVDLIFRNGTATGLPKISALFLNHWAS